MRRAPRSRPPGVFTVYSRYQPRSRGGRIFSRLPNVAPSRWCANGPPFLIRSSVSMASLGSCFLSISLSAKERLQQENTSARKPANSLTGVALLFRFSQRDVQLAQLALGDRRRRAGDEVLAALRLRECDHVADRIGADHQRHQPVEAEGDAAMGRRAVLQRLQQEAEFGLLVFGRNLQRAKHLLLDFLAVDA